MPLQQLFLLAVVAVVFLAAMRVIRVGIGLTPHPEGIGKLLFGLAFVIVPPMALGALIDQGGGSGLLTGVTWVPIYAIFLVGLLIAMWLAAAVVSVAAPRQARPLVLALVGRERDPYEPSNPPVTPRLASIVAHVQRANDVFPRGMGFRAEIDRVGFRGSWDALDAATGQLEGAMAEEHRLRRGVPSSVTATAQDARARLNTLRQLAIEEGQSWATA